MATKTKTPKTKCKYCGNVMTAELWSENDKGTVWRLHCDTCHGPKEIK